MCIFNLFSQYSCGGTQTGLKGYEYGMCNMYKRSVKERGTFIVYYFSQVFMYINELIFNF